MTHHPADRSPLSIRSPRRALVRGRSCGRRARAGRRQPVGRSRAPSSRRNLRRSRSTSFSLLWPTSTGGRAARRRIGGGNPGSSAPRLPRSSLPPRGGWPVSGGSGASRSSCRDAPSAADVAALAQAVAEGLSLAEFSVGSHKTDEPAVGKTPVWTITLTSEARARRSLVCDGRGCPRARARRVQQPGARAGQRAGQHADAAGVRAPGGGDREPKAASASRFSTKRRSPSSAWACCSASRAAAASRRALMVFRHDPPGAPTTPGARPGRQRHHVRHRRHLDQAGRRHGADEGRHGRRRRRGLRDARHRPAQGADARHRRRADDGEHAGRPGDQAGRHPEERARARRSK